MKSSSEQLVDLTTQIEPGIASGAAVAAGQVFTLITEMVHGVASPRPKDMHKDADR
jgi:hypothetical protein